MGSLRMTAAKSDERPFESLKLFTHDVDRVLLPSQDGELAHAIHETLHFALDGQPKDYLVPRPRGQDNRDQAHASSSSSTSSSSSLDEDKDSLDVRPGFYPTDDPERPYVSYGWDDKKALLTLPHPSTLQSPAHNDSGARDAAEYRQTVDVTVKFFYLQSGAEYPPEWIDEAMDCLGTVTGFTEVDTLILAFPSLRLDCSKASDEQIRQKASRVTNVWRRVSSSPRIASMGLSDLSARSLDSILDLLELPDSPRAQDAQHDLNNSVDSNGSATGATKANGTGTPVQIPSSPSQVSFVKGLEDEKEALRLFGPGPNRRPRLCTINLREQKCHDDSLGGESFVNSNPSRSTCWDRNLADLCKKRKVLLVAHSDQKDILPARTLPSLLQEFQDRVPHSNLEGQQVVPLWCLKYTVLIRDRAILADKGFILFCKSVSN